MVGYIVLAQCSHDDVVCGLYYDMEFAVQRALIVAATPEIRHTCQPLSSDTEMLHVSVIRTNGSVSEFVGLVLAENPTAFIEGDTLAETSRRAQKIAAEAER